MKIKSILQLVPVCIFLSLTGCSERQPELEEVRSPEQETVETEVQSMQQYRDEAKNEITEENAEEELQRLTQEIEKDAVESGNL